MPLKKFLKKQKKKQEPSCQCSYINKEGNNGLGYLFQLRDGAVFFSGCTRLFFYSARGSFTVNWLKMFSSLSVCVCCSLSCTDKLIIIFTLNRALSVFPHLHYSLLVEDTTSAYLVENKTYNHDNYSST